MPSLRICLFHSNTDRALDSLRLMSPWFCGIMWVRIPLHHFTCEIKSYKVNNKQEAGRSP